MLVRLCLFAVLWIIALRTVADDPSNTGHRGYETLSKPIEEHDRPALQSVRDFWLTPDAKTLVVHEWREEGKENVDRVVVVDVASAKVLKVLLERRGGWDPFLPMHVSADGAAVIIAKANGLDAYDLTSGEIRKHYAAPDGKKMTGYYGFSETGSRAAGITRDGGLVLWDLGSGKSALLKPAIALEKGITMPYPLGERDQVLVLNQSDVKGVKNRIVLVDAKSGVSKTLCELEDKFLVCPTAEGNRAYVVREDPQKGAWSNLEEWDLLAGKLLGKQTLPGNVTVGQRLSPDGTMLLRHEELIRVVIVWNLKMGKVAGVVVPTFDGSIGGCQAFDVSRDGKKLVALTGPWKEGSLVLEKLAVFDLSKLNPEKP